MAEDGEQPEDPEDSAQPTVDATAPAQQPEAPEAEADEADEVATRPADTEPPEHRLRKPWLITVGAAVVVIVGLLAASGYIAWQHHGAMAHRQRVAASTAAAKQGVINIMSVDFRHVEDDIGRLLDSSTGEFKDDFEHQAADFIAVAKKSHVVSNGTVNSAAVESMDKDSAVVLVSSTSYVTNSAGAKEEPRQWRLRVTVTKDDDQIKMSKLVYVP